MSFRFRISVLVVVAAVLALPLAAAYAQNEYDPLSIETGVSGHGKQVITVTAGPSGAPNGFTMWWMTESQFSARQNLWPSEPISGQGAVSFEDTPTLNTGGGAYTTFKLGPNESIVIEVGDLFDETGVVGTVSDELTPGVSYVFTGFANGDGQTMSSSDLSDNGVGTTSTSDNNCTYTIGWYKNHPGQWAFASISLGSVSYTASEMLQILQTPAQGNGLIALAHQLIAAKLSILLGADGSAVTSTIANADAMIGSLVVPPIGSGYLSPTLSLLSLVQQLDNYNNGITGPGHCAVTASQPTSWGAIKATYRK